ncbi:Sec-independent protein translocase protein TatB [Marinobacter zhejiangensis]|uniref:Sec-independent protein translocase protein TatB n=1 Tax=Marinobacter zhejiangensis TaxID=488535 RepID=A0A1I4SHX9_9GAMM|nr:Sec-independent protein translocase protein TatB [Marinobacter zhejiangensis]SFM64057.1 sec-independent protein translocase protein TatB [Marinobacter zhejiangensis]
MFDIGFLELLICGVIALLVLGPERLPSAARTAGRWVGNARRLMNQFSTELDRQIKAEELREQLRKAGDVGLDDVEKTVRDALDEAKKYEHLVVSDPSRQSPRPAPATPGIRKDTTAQSTPPSTDQPTDSESAQANDKDSPPETRS